MATASLALVAWGLVQPSANARSDARGTGSRARRRQPAEEAQHPSQAVQDVAALRTLAGVSLDPGSCAGCQVAVEVGGHVTRRPAVIDPEARAMQNLAHPRSDPSTIQKGSHSESRT